VKHISGVSADSKILRSTALDVTVYIYVREKLGSNLGKETGCPDISFILFPQSFQATAGTVIRVGHDRFLAHSFQVIVHPSSYHQMLHNLDTEGVVK
jgi:hypothetical protein